MTNSMEVKHLKSGQYSAILGLGDNGPQLLYFGPRLSDATAQEPIALASLQSPPQAGLDQLVVPSLVPTASHGWQGSEPIEIVDPRGRPVPYYWSCSWGRISKLGADVKLKSQYAIGTLSIRFESQAALTFDLKIKARKGRLSSIGLSLPFSQEYTRLRLLSGRWNAEFNQELMQIRSGSSIRIENRQGRTSHYKHPAIILETSGVNENQGQALSAVLETSANYCIEVERLYDGVGGAMLSLALPDQPQEAHIRIALAQSQTGLEGIARAWQSYVRGIRPLGPRAVNYNTWEGVYFDHNPVKLNTLVDMAADLGVERWVLDDGWFEARNDDTSSLGDWQVDSSKYPQGLMPLIERVKSKEMLFGLWVEPEMVNPNSKLFRSNPNWVLSHGNAPLITARNQVVLNLALPEVQNFMVESVGQLLDQYPIDYLKWDMNRDTWQRFGADGDMVSEGFRAGLISALQRLRRPGLEIESCASGGGRANFEILQVTDRIWTSDCNDALERHRIQDGFSLFFPPEVMGAHVGPLRCHTTERILPIEFRAQMALFGHFGMEMDLQALTGERVEILRHWIDVYKRFRELLHGGLMLRFDRPDPHERCHGVVSPQKDEALIQVVQLDRSSYALPLPLRLHDLDPQKTYTLKPLSPIVPSVLVKDLPALWKGDQSITATGEFFMQIGVPLPAMPPAHAITFHLKED